VTQAALDPLASPDRRVQGESKVSKEALELQVTLGRLDFEVSRDLLVDLDLLEQQVYQVNGVSKVLQATLGSRVLPVTLE